LWSNAAATVADHAATPDSKSKLTAPSVQVSRVGRIDEARFGWEQLNSLPFSSKQHRLDLLQIPPVHDRSTIVPADLEHRVLGLSAARQRVPSPVVAHDDGV